jgi:hypothetical protein
MVQGVLRTPYMSDLCPRLCLRVANSREGPDEAPDGAHDPPSTDDARDASTGQIPGCCVKDPAPRNLDSVRNVVHYVTKLIREVR